MFPGNIVVVYTTATILVLLSISFFLIFYSRKKNTSLKTCCCLKPSKDYDTNKELCSHVFVKLLKLDLMYKEISVSLNSKVQRRLRPRYTMCSSPTARVRPAGWRLSCGRSWSAPPPPPAPPTPAVSTPGTSCPACPSWTRSWPPSRPAGGPSSWWAGATAGSLGRGWSGGRLSFRQQRTGPRCLLSLIFRTVNSQFQRLIILLHGSISRDDIEDRELWNYMVHRKYIDTSDTDWRTKLR